MSDTPCIVLCNVFTKSRLLSIRKSNLRLDRVRYRYCFFELTRRHVVRRPASSKSNRFPKVLRVRRRLYNCRNVHKTKQILARFVTRSPRSIPRELVGRDNDGETLRRPPAGQTDKKQKRTKRSTERAETRKPVFWASGL